MTLVQSPDGPIETDLPADEVADLQVEKPAEPAPEPAKAAEPETPPAPAPAEVTPEVPPAPEAAPEAPKGKAKPIANLLSKLNDERTAREAAERRAAEAEAKLSQPPAPAAPVAPAATPAADDITELAARHGITDPSLLKDLADTIRKGIPAQQNAGLPQEVQDMIAEHQQQKAIQAETAAFNTRVDKLGTVFKDEPIAAQKDKLMELAYSTEKAPDGERYCDKELSELYFGFIKPTIEPGTVSAEPSRGTSGGGTKVTDFQEIFDRDDPKDIEAMSDEQFAKYNAWMTKTQGDVPIRRAN